MKRQMHEDLVTGWLEQTGKKGCWVIGLMVRIITRPRNIEVGLRLIISARQYCFFLEDRDFSVVCWHITCDQYNVPDAQRLGSLSMWV